MSTILIDLEQLRLLAGVSLRNGTEASFIPLALEWAEAAQKEISRLQEELQRNQTGELK